MRCFVRHTEIKIYDSKTGDFHLNATTVTLVIFTLYGRRTKTLVILFGITSVFYTLFILDLPRSFGGFIPSVLTDLTIAEVLLRHHAIHPIQGGEVAAAACNAAKHLHEPLLVALT